MFAHLEKFSLNCQVRCFQSMLIFSILIKPSLFLYLYHYHYHYLFGVFLSLVNELLFSGVFLNSI